MAQRNRTKAIALALGITTPNVLGSAVSPATVPAAGIGAEPGATDARQTLLTELMQLTPAQKLDMAGARIPPLDPSAATRVAVDESAQTIQTEGKALTKNQIPKENSQITKGNNQQITKSNNQQITKGNNQQITKGNQQITKGNQQLTKGNEQITKGNEQITKGNAQITKGNTALTKGNAGTQNALTKGSAPNVESVR